MEAKAAAMRAVLRHPRFDCDYFVHDCARNPKFLFTAEPEFRAIRQNLVSIGSDRDEEPY
jgi:hypothetical protein